MEAQEVEEQEKKRKRKRKRQRKRGRKMVAVVEMPKEAVEAVVRGVETKGETKRVVETR